MVDLEGKDKGNISLPPRLQSPDIIDPDLVDDEHRVPIVNMQKAMYDILISDKEDRIKRLEDRNNELLETSAETEVLINNMDIETKDDIAYLNRQISVQTDKIIENMKNINFIEEKRKQEKEVHLRNVSLVNGKYEATHVALTSEIKALNAQINTLEDYKQVREKLTEKLRKRNETMMCNEEEVTQRLDAVNRKLKMDKEKLKIEMYNRLLALAGSFQIENAKFFPKSVQRLLRENIFIKNELMQMADEGSKKQEDCTMLQSMDNLHLNSMMIDSRDRNDHLKGIKVKRCVIGALKERHSFLKKRLENLGHPEECIQEKYDNLAETASLELEHFDLRRRKLEVLLHQESVKLCRTKFDHSQTEFRVKKYEEILYDLKYAIASALKLTESGEDIQQMGKKDLISHLWNIIVRGNAEMHCLGVASVETVLRPDAVYVKGDLGFVPEHILFEEPTTKEFYEPSSLESLVFAVSEVTSPLIPTAELKDYSDDFGVASSVISEASSGKTISTESKGIEEEPEDSHQEISIMESVEEVHLETEESAESGLDEEAQEQ